MGGRGRGLVRGRRVSLLLWGKGGRQGLGWASWNDANWGNEKTGGREVWAV